MRIRMRKSHHTHPVPTLKNCPQCGAPQLPHRVCLACGTYKGRQVLTVKVE